MMEKLIPHIEKLLIKNDYVIIPDFGGFVIQSQSAKITSAGIIPPVSTIGFNPGMSNNDGLLALELVRTEKISYKEANKQIAVEVEKLEVKLHQAHSIQIGRLGAIKLDNQQNKSFIPAKELGFLPANIGLKTVHLQQRKKQEEQIIISVPKKSVFKYAATILVLLSILLVSPKLGDNSQIDYAGFNFKPKAIPAPVQEVKEVEVFAEEIVVENESESVPEIIVKEFHIVVACLRTLEQAEDYRDMLIKRQYSSVRVIPSVRTNRVIIKSFSNKDEAVDYLRNIRHSDRLFKDAWLHQQTIEL